MFCTRHSKFLDITKIIIRQRYILHNSTIISSHLCKCKNLPRVRFLSTTLQTKFSDKVLVADNLGPKTVIDSKSKENKNSMSSNDLLEKLIAGISTDIHNKHRVYKNDLLRVITKITEINFSTKKQQLLLIKCCAEFLPDESTSSRMGLLEQIWSTTKAHADFDVDHYNELLRVYISVGKKLVVSSFINQMAPSKPNMTTYELILKTLAEAGDVNQSTEVISNMKSQNLPTNESIFNSLILCQGRAGNMKNIQEVLSMMKSLKIEKSVDTYTAIICSLAWNKKGGLLIEEMEKVIRNGLKFEETHIMNIVKTLAVVGLYDVVPKVLRFLPPEILEKPSITPYMQSITTYLVFQNHPIIALEIYKCLPLPAFGPKDDQGLHGRSLVRDCVKASVPASVIGLVTQELMSTGRNPIALHNASEAALQLGKIPLALDMFVRMQQLGMPIRPHYFWPIFIQNSKNFGEKGIMSTLSIMVTMDVKPDYDTMLEYALPFVSFTSPQNLMKKFLDTGLTVTTVLTPMMVILLSTGQVRAASEICELFQGKVDAQKLLKPLLKGYFMSEDEKSTVYLLEDLVKKASDKNKDWLGRFFCAFIADKRVKHDLTEFLNLVKALKSTPLKISTAASDYCMNRLPDHYDSATVDVFRNHLVEITDERLVDDGVLFVHQMVHPKQMNEESLKAHLNELDAKGMNTRGVLRKLLQQYCREGNLKAATDIVNRCQKEGVFLSAGMKASIFDLHVKQGELDLAEVALADLNKTAPNFTLDEYKVIDFATLMVHRKKIGKAFELITEQSKKRRIVGGNGIAMNCWRLLDATATHGTHAETRKMFDLLSNLRYCKPSNVFLGPLIRVHLKNDNIEAAVKEFDSVASKYKKTPLKHELVCQILTQMGDGKSEEAFIINEKSNSRLNKLAQDILNVVKRVHGAGDVQLTMIAALANVGYKSTLRKMFLDPTVKFHPDALLRVCERFADEKKLQALSIVAECATDLRRVDVNEVYDLMLDVYQRDDDYQGALRLWTRMQELNIVPSKKFIRNICSLGKACNKVVPPELTSLLDKQEAAHVLSGTNQA